MKRGLVWWQWETLLVTMAGYALYYVVRKNLSLAMPLLGEEFGITKVQLGAFLTLHGLVYGFARFANGVLTDRNSARKVMAVGLFACAVVNLVFGLSDHVARALAAWFADGGPGAFMACLVWTMGIVWIVHGYFQGMGVGPCVKTLPQWFPSDELATKQSIWNLSHSIGAGGVFALLGWWVIPAFHAWRLCFLVPALLAAAGSVGLLFAMKDSPKDVGLPELPGRKVSVVTTPEGSATYRTFVAEHVFRNPAIWILAVSNFFMNTIRFAALDWGPTLLVESKGLSLAAATTLCFAFEIVGGNLGMIVAGWASDRFFGSRTHRTCVLCFVGVAVAVAAFWFVPATAPFALKLLPFAAIGFFLYGPQALLGIASTQQATPRAAASANGVLGVAGYLSTILSGVGFGWMAGLWGWEAVFATMLVSAVLGGAVVALMWKAPALSCVALLCGFVVLLGSSAVASTPEGFVVVTDYLAADGATDVSETLQKVIDEHPNRTIYFPDGTYPLAKPLLTPAHPKRSVDLRLSNYAVIKAAPGWHSEEALVRLGGKDPANDIRTPGSNYSFTGGIVDGSGVAKGISIDGGRETKVRDVSMKNVSVGLHIKRGANSGSSDCDIIDVNIVGNGATNSVGVLVEGFDNTLSNMRIARVYTGVRLCSGANSLRNIHPLFNCDAAAYPTSIGFDNRHWQNWFDFCYPDHFSTGFNIGKGGAGVYNSCYCYWYAPNPGLPHTAVRAEGRFNAIFRDFTVGFFGDKATNAVLTIGEDGGRGRFDNLRYRRALVTEPVKAHLKYLKGVEL